MSSVHEWWGSLRHSGVLVAPALLPEFFPAEPQLDARRYDALRDAWVRFEGEDPTSESRRTMVEAVLEGFLHLGGWKKGPQVPKEFRAQSATGHRLRPDRVLLAGEDARLALVFDDADRVGVGRGRRALANLVELLRATGIPLGIVTNARQLRLVFAGPDYEAWSEWEIAAWFDEGEGREQLRVSLFSWALRPSDDPKNRPSLLPSERRDHARASSPRFSASRSARRWRRY